MNQPWGFWLVIVTAFVGSVALYIYKRQNNDQRKLAAQTIYSELSTAENRLKGLRTRFFAVDRPVLESVKVMSYESWTRHKYLFLKDLSSEEWTLIDDFYSNCIAYDTAVETNKETFRQIIKENYKYLYGYYAEKVNEYHKTNPTKTTLTKKLLEDVNVYQALYLNKGGNTLDYVPLQATNEARSALVALEATVTLTSAGQKLKKIAKLRSRT